MSFLMFQPKKLKHIKKNFYKIKNDKFTKKFQSHFEDNILRKPIIIDKEGEYNIDNDILIDFSPIVNYEEIQNLPSLRYGFFGGIIIVAENVTMDLHGHEIKMSSSFALSQRFFLF